MATFTNLTLSLAGTYAPTATGGELTPDFSNAFTVSPSVVTAGFKFKREPLHKVGRRGRSQMMSQAIKITNTTRHADSGPLALVLAGVPTGVTLAHASGTYQGNPYIDFEQNNNALAPGKSVTVSLDFAVSGHRALGRQAL